MTTRETPHLGQTNASATFAEAIPLALLDEPLNYVLVDHSRQRSLCTAMRSFSETGHVDRSVADMVVAYLGRDLGLHHRDEEDDLFALLRRRMLPEDDLGSALAQLVEDHRRSQSMVETIIDALSARPTEGPVGLTRSTRELMLAYAGCEHRHLAAENGIVLAIARIRLTRGDLKAMSRTMKERRGVQL